MWIEEVQAGFGLLPAVVRKPAVVRRWLLGARSAQAAALLTLALALVALPSLNAALDRRYPPIESRSRVERFFNRVTSRPDPRLAARQRQLALVLWTAGASAFGALLFSQLPRAVARAAERAGELERLANSASSTQPIESARLYWRAAGLTLDADLSDKLLARSAVLFAAKSDGSFGPSEDVGLRALGPVESVVAPDGARTYVGIEHRYRVVKEIGRGGMGVVYQAFDEVLERDVALKELASHLNATPDFVRRFKQEARTLAQLSHPNIVQVYDLVEAGDRLWIALELVQGGTLANVIGRHARGLLWRDALEFGRQIAAGLACAHSSAIVHRDIKPGNVLLTQEVAGIAKLSDFGVAKHMASSVHTREGTLLGSARYMSPEQAAGRSADERSDVYSLGVTLYEMLVGHPPFLGEVSAVLAQHLSQTPPPIRPSRPHVPGAVEDFVLSLLRKAPGERPESAVAVVKTLAGILSEDVQDGDSTRVLESPV